MCGLSGCGVGGAIDLEVFGYSVDLSILSQKLTIFPVLRGGSSSTHPLAIFTHACGSSRLRNQINLIRSIGEWRAEQKQLSHSFVSEIHAKFML